MPKMCELIHVGRIGTTPRKLACSHMKRRIAYGFDAASQFAAKNECADEHQQKAYQGRSDQGLADAILDFFQCVRIAADNQNPALIRGSSTKQSPSPRPPPPHPH